MVSERNFGVEIEFSNEFKDVLDIVRKIIPSNKLLYKKEKFPSEGKTWDIKIESLDQTEIATPILKRNARGYGLFIKVIEALRDMRCTKREGLHVHVDCGGISQYQVLLAWLSIEETVKQMFPKHRRNISPRCTDPCGKYICNKKPKHLADIFKQSFDICDNYDKTLSFKHFDSRKTVEFRLMEANVSWYDISNWIAFCLHFMDYAETINPFMALCDEYERMSVDQLIEKLKIENEFLQIWMRGRWLTR